MKIGTWLLALVQPFIVRILTALGFSLVTIAAVLFVLAGASIRFGGYPAFDH